MRAAMSPISVIFILCLCSVFAEEECENKFITSHFYRELNCKPVFENDSKVPKSYDCSDFESRDRNSCRYKGVSYPVDSEIPNEVADICVAGCRCVNDTRPYFTCANVECFGDWTPLEDNCKRLFDEKLCCSKGKYCKGKDPEPETCKYGEKTYVEGEKFYPEDEPCKVCYCKKGFTGKLEEPFCKDVSCNVELHSGRNINDGCVPIYYGVQGCCPIDWKCPSASTDEVVPPQGKTEVPTTAEKCKFGNLILNQNDILKTSGGVECKCSLPPYLTCIQPAASV